MKNGILIGIFMIAAFANAQNKAKKQFYKNTLSKQQSANVVSPLYAFSTFTSPYNAISGTTVTGNQKWDDLSYGIPLGFNFTLYAQSGSNFIIGLGGQLFSFNNPDTDPYITLAAPMFEDLCDRAYDPNADSEGDPGGISHISYTTVGSPGSQICKIQVANAGFFGENDAFATSTSYVNFQIWLYETSNRIEFHYGNVNIQNPVDNLINGANGFVSGLADSVDVNTGNATSSNMLDGPYASPNVFPWNANLTTYIAGAIDSGRVYRFDRVIATSLKINDLETGIQIYPNPASDKLILKGVDLKNAQITIYDVNGKINSGYAIGNNSVDVSGLKNGIYFLQIKSKDNTSTRKIVIAR
jgi:hypothetical protein